MKRQALAVLSLVVLAYPIWWATEQSAQSAVEQALKEHMTLGQMTALVRLLVEPKDSGILAVDLNGHSVRFTVEGDTVKVAGEGPGGTAAAPPATAEAPGCAVVMGLHHPLALARLATEIESEGHAVKATGQRVLTVTFAQTGDTATMVQDGTICVQCRQSLDSLAITDQLEAEMGALVLKAVESDNRIPLGEARARWTQERQYFSSPAGGLKWVTFFSGTDEARVMGSNVTRPVMPEGFRATLEVPEDVAQQVKQARLRVLAEAGVPDSALGPLAGIPLAKLVIPSFAVDGEEVVRGAEADQVGGEITKYMLTGSHELTATRAGGPRRDYAPCSFEVYLLLGAPCEGQLEARVGTQATMSKSSAPVGEIAKQ